MVGLFVQSRARPEVGTLERHLLGVEHALVPHHVFEKGDLALVDEEHQLAGLAEIGLRGGKLKVARRWSLSRAMVAAAMASSVPPMQ